MPGMCDTPAFLNLHLLLWDSYITDRMSGRLVSVEGRTSVADTHLAFARSQNCRKRHFGCTKDEKQPQGCFFNVLEKKNVLPQEIQAAVGTGGVF